MSHKNKNKNKMNRTQRRLTKEISELHTFMQEEPDVNFSIGPKSETDLFEWEGTLFGPKDSPYEGGFFNIHIFFNEDYPLRPPTIRFKTRIFHPNISLDGSICLDILKTDWSPALSMTKVMLSLSSLLTDPNPSSPLNGEAARLHTNPIAYKEKVQEYIRIYCV